MVQSAITESDLPRAIRPIYNHKTRNWRARIITNNQNPQKSTEYQSRNSHMASDLPITRQNMKSHVSKFNLFSKNSDQNQNYPAYNRGQLLKCS